MGLICVGQRNVFQTKSFHVAWPVHRRDMVTEKSGNVTFSGGRIPMNFLRVFANRKSFEFNQGFKELRNNIRQEMGNRRYASYLAMDLNI
jgi:hypothetical protein